MSLSGLIKGTRYHTSRKRRVAWGNEEKSGGYKTWILVSKFKHCLFLFLSMRILLPQVCHIGQMFGEVYYLTHMASICRESYCCF